MGRRWVMEKGIRVPKVTRVVEIFLNATGTWVSPNIIWQCWPAQPEHMPVQNLEGVRQSIVCKLDEVATMYMKSCVGLICIAANGSGILERRGLMLPPWEDARRRDVHARLQTDAPR